MGCKFEPDQANLRRYGWDSVVAMTAAAFPWVLVVLDGREPFSWLTIYPHASTGPGRRGVDFRCERVYLN